MTRMLAQLGPPGGAPPRVAGRSATTGTEESTAADSGALFAGLVAGRTGDHAAGTRSAPPGPAASGTPRPEAAPTASLRGVAGIARGTRSWPLIQQL